VIELIVIIVTLLAGWLVVMYLRRNVTIEKARTRGLEVMKQHLKNPVLLEDYAEAKGLSKAEVDALVRQGKITAYQWYQYTYVEADNDSNSVNRPWLIQD
jgi:hypothetical protein